MRSLCIALVLLAACFSDVGGEGGGTTAAGCPEGSNGCACYGNDTCDAELECSMGVCIVPGCTPGALDCTCVDGECLGDLVCEGGACHEPPVGSEGSGTSTVTSTGTTAGSGADGMVTFTDGAESVDTGQVTTGPVCLDASCTECRDCATYGPCYEQYMDCEADPQCAALMACLSTCARGDVACQMDCSIAHMDGVAKFEPFALCVNCQCAVQCMSAC